MKIPLHRMKKKEIVYMATHYCDHGHTFLSHPSCYEGHEPRTGFLDIESSGLVADFGIMLSYCIKEYGSNKIYYSVITKRDIESSKEGDEKVVRQCIEDIGKFDRIITFYGKRFDVPFIRTRALVNGIDFPGYGTLCHDDLYFVVRHRFKLSSNRLENACRVLLGASDKTRIEKWIWRAAGRGDEKALKYVLEHNKYDVLDLEKLYEKVMGFAARRDTSI